MARRVLIQIRLVKCFLLRQVFEIINVATAKSWRSLNQMNVRSGIFRTINVIFVIIKVILAIAQNVF